MFIILLNICKYVLQGNRESKGYLFFEEFVTQNYLTSAIHILQGTNPFLKMFHNKVT